MIFIFDLNYENFNGPRSSDKATFSTDELPAHREGKVVKTVIRNSHKFYLRGNVYNYSLGCNTD